MVLLIWYDRAVDAPEINIIMYIYMLCELTNNWWTYFKSRTVLYWETLPWNKVKTCIRIKRMLSSPLVIGKRGMSHILIVGIGWHRYCMVLHGIARLITLAPSRLCRLQGLWRWKCYSTTASLMSLSADDAKRCGPKVQWPDFLDYHAIQQWR